MCFKTNHLLKIFVLSSCVVFTACVGFVRPLPNTVKIEQDKRLSGKWRGEVKKGEFMVIQFGSEKNNKTSVQFFEENEEQVSKDNLVFKIETATIKDKQYAILRPFDSFSREGYFLVRYAANGDKLKIWVLKEDEIKKAISNEEIKGQSKSGGWIGSESTTITDTPQKILQFIEKDELYVYFAEFEKTADK